jgi:hypothetical protein
LSLSLCHPMMFLLVSCSFLLRNKILHFCSQVVSLLTS